MADDHSITIPAWVDGELTAIGKLEAHKLGLRHKAVSVFVSQGDRILLQQRALSKYHTPGLWANTCCTHPHWGEAPLDCAGRRLQDELGITGLDLSHKGTIEYRADVGGGMIEHEVVDLFVATCASAPDMSPNPDEVMATRWASLTTLRDEIARSPEQFTPWLRIYMAEHAQRIFSR